MPLRILDKPLIALSLAAACNFAAASPSDPAVEAVFKFLRQHTAKLSRDVRIEVYPPSAKLPYCEHPSPFLPAKGQKLQGRITVGVRCGEKGRVRYLQAKVSVVGDYWVAARPIAAGTPIDASMLRRVRGDLAELPRGALLDLKQIIGQVASRPLSPGTVLQEQLLKPHPLVYRRQPVTLEARGRGFRIVREGIALEEGGLGEKIRVQLPDRKLVSAIVSGPGQARVDF